jgi:preprotein translocase SecE subunit
MKKIMKMVQYPTKKEVLKLTMIVIVSMILISGIIFGIDTGILKVYQSILS